MALLSHMVTWSCDEPGCTRKTSLPLFEGDQRSSGPGGWTFGPEGFRCFEHASHLATVLARIERHLKRTELRLLDLEAKAPTPSEPSEPVPDEVDRLRSRNFEAARELDPSSPEAALARADEMIDRFASRARIREVVSRWENEVVLDGESLVIAKRMAFDAAWEAFEAGQEFVPSWLVRMLATACQAAHGALRGQNPPGSGPETAPPGGSPHGETT
jgi:hypothetical protein